MTKAVGTAWLHRLRERGVIRVAAIYAVITWLLLQIADVTFEPLGVPRWVMVSLIVTAILGFPVAARPKQRRLARQLTLFMIKPSRRTGRLQRSRAKLQR